jgi:hypothetical protein
MMMDSRWELMISEKNHNNNGIAWYFFSSARLDLLSPIKQEARTEAEK